MITYRDTQTENTIDRLPAAQDQLRAHLAEIEGFEPNFVVYLNGEERLMIDAECEKVPSLESLISTNRNTIASAIAWLVRVMDCTELYLVEK